MRLAPYNPESVHHKLEAHSSLRHDVSLNGGGRGHLRPETDALQPLRLQITLCFKRGHAAGPGSRNGLPVFLILHIARRIDTRYVGPGIVGQQIAAIIHIDLTLKGSGVRFVPDGDENAFNREVAGLRDKTELWCHTCWGSPAAQRTRAEAYSYEAALPHLDRLDVDVLTFEGKETDGADFERIAREVSADKKIALGVISHRTLQVERAD